MVVGLGNPGKKYEHTRHNAGFAVVDELARRWAVRFRRSWVIPAETARGGAAALGEDCWLVKPQTYMNRSGAAVAPLARKKGVQAGDLVVVVDDAELPLGKLRIRQRGGSGGHNGLKSLIESLGTEDFVRLRVGVGRKGEGADLADHVLSPLSREDRRALEESAGRAADALEVMAREGAEAAMNKFN